MSYTYQVVSNPDAADGTWLGGINNAGEAVGYDSGFGGDHYKHAFIYTNGALSPITAGPNNQASANGINNLGWVVGAYGSSPIGEHGYLRAPDGTVQRVSSVPDQLSPSGIFDIAYGVNDSGTVVGVDFPSGHQGFVWQNGSFTSLFQVPGATMTEARAINNSGEIVGVFGMGNQPEQGFTDIGGKFGVISLPGAIETDVNAVDSSGVIAGSYSDGSRWHGFVDDRGQITTVDAPGAINTWIYGINDFGQLSGAFSPAAGPPVKGFIASPDAPTNPPPSKPPPTLPPPSRDLSVLDTSTNTPLAATGTPYTGPVAGLQSEYINITSDSLNVTTLTPNWFIHTGGGTDAIAVLGGTNVLDGGTGSNFLTSGTGTDTFFVDDRSAPADIWSTIVGFHQGDAATVWGVTPQDFNLAWADNQGAAGYTGLTLHATTPSHPTASLTLAGYTQSDLTNGRLGVQFGTDTASGSSYMFIHGNS